MKQTLFATLIILLSFTSSTLAQDSIQNSLLDTIQSKIDITNKQADSLPTKTLETVANTVENITDVSAMIPTDGFSMNSLLRGILGMLALLVIAFLLSTNKKAINWKTIGFGLMAQLILAIGVLKVPFVQSLFEFVGKIFVKILEFTQAGCIFLLGDLMTVHSYGFIFIFQILPTIIFFSALTPVFFYLGVIHILVEGLAWV